MKQNILRENDIRGAYPEEINAEVAYKIGQAWGTYVLNQKENTTIIGYDNRLSSVELKEALIKGLTSTGINVIDIGLCTTPLLNYASISLKREYALMVTASHNPPDYNGFKVYWEDGGQTPYPRDDCP